MARETPHIECARLPRYRVELPQHEQPLQRQGAAHPHSGAHLQSDFAAAGLHAQASWLQDEQEQSGLAGFDI
ncbi:MAG TPA: hypothetical protein VER96_26320 [Polyangiaceae bacterium]|nr:hypothetical protein [Polyangiaceae bacterium]